MKLTNEMCDAEFKKLGIDAKRNLASILIELQAATEKHPKGVWGKKRCDFVHAAAVVAEEAGELVRAALSHRYEKGQYYNMHREAIQTGAMVLRFLNNAPELPWPLRKSTKGGRRG